ncbi:MAG TPA: iron ABC transporter permease [Chitinispirillaceae bacterium]|nr:iron ABC transporter permease [Chitinispirillaceae bacterium]
MHYPDSFKLIILFIICMIAAFVSLVVGHVNIEPREIMQIFLSVIKGEPMQDLNSTIILSLRLPRIAAAFLIGGALALNGSVYQSLFRNPMVSPSILGLSSGAGFGAALAITLGLNMLLTYFVAFAGGIAAVMSVLVLTRIGGNVLQKNLVLILAGMVAGTFFSALLSILKYLADPDNTLPNIVYWLMGSLASVQTMTLIPLAVIILPSVMILSRFGWQLDIMSCGEDEAKTLGVAVQQVRIVSIVLATLMTSAAVCVTGIIGWVGLFIPHCARFIMGQRNSLLLPASFLAGGAFLILADCFSRAIISTEIPIGITTSLIGAFFFVILIIRIGRKSQYD